MRLLEGLSQQAAAALENASLFEKVDRQQREEAMLLEVVSSIASEIRLEPLLAKILTAATQLLELLKKEHDAVSDQNAADIDQLLNAKQSLIECLETLTMKHNGLLADF